MKRLAMTAILVIALLVPAFAGEVPTVGKAEPQPTPTQTTSTSSSTSIATTILLTLLALRLP
jgi:hypothetical protein